MTLNPALREEQRLAMLRRFQVMDSAPDRAFDIIVKGLAHLYGVHACLITFMDDQRQFFKAAAGTSLTEMSVVDSFCQYTLQGDEVLVIEDLNQHARTSAHPLVTGEPELRFYAGAPIITEGFRIGTVCVFDTVPHRAEELDLGLLMHMANLVAFTLLNRQQGARGSIDFPSKYQSSVAVPVRKISG